MSEEINLVTLEVEVEFCRHIEESTLWVDTLSVLVVSPEYRDQGAGNIKKLGISL